MNDFQGELLCGITGVERVNKKEFRFLLNPQPLELKLTVPEPVVQEWFPGKPLYLAITDLQQDIENIETLRFHKKSVWKGTLLKNDGSLISVTGTLLPVQTLPKIHRETGKLWEKVIQLTADYMGDQKNAYAYVKQYLMHTLEEEPLQFKTHRYEVSCLEAVAEAFRQMPQLQVLNRRPPSVEELERWLCAHAVTAIQKDLVILKKGKLWFNLENMVHAYLGIL